MSRATRAIAIPIGREDGEVVGGIGVSESEPIEIESPKASDGNTTARCVA